MTSITIYHNPQCSKSRQTLALLEERGIQPQVIEYLKTPLSQGKIKDLLTKLDVPMQAIVRVKDAATAGIDINLDDSDNIANVLVQYPKLMERPIVVKGHRAVLGRPPENVLKLLIEP